MRILLLVILTLASVQDLICQDSPIIQKATSYLSGPGDNQQQKTGTDLNNPIAVKVIDEAGNPLANIPIRFEELSTPGKSTGFRIKNKIVYTDSTGHATTPIRLGNQEGEYTILVRFHDNPSEQFLIYRFAARKSDWIFMMVITLLGGLVLFLMGMKMMSDGMQKSAGAKLRSILGTLTKNRFMALMMGTLVTIIIQSSSATTVMLVSFVNSGLMVFSQTLGVILGASIGTTITAQLIAFKITDYALLMIAIGFAMNSISKNEKLRYSGEALMGFGILFFGMGIMSEAMVPLRTSTVFINFILHLENPITGILIGTLFTALIQSSSAFIGIMIVLASQGLLTLEASIPLLLGANIGTAVTAILASIKTTTEAKKVAVAHTLFRIFGVLLLVWWIPDFVRIVESVSPKAGGIDEMNNASIVLPRQIANAHTIFNVFVTLVILPFLNSIAKFIDWLIPKKETEKLQPFATKYINESQNIPPSLALNLIKQEVIHMAHIVQKMADSFIAPFIHNEQPDLDLMNQKEEEVDFLRDRINSYLLKIISGDIESERTQEAFQIMYTVKEFEQIADILRDTYFNKTHEWIEKRHEFSDEGKEELSSYHIQVLKQLARSVEVFREVNLEKAKLMKTKHNKYRIYALDLEKSHYRRLMEMKEKSLNTSKTHLELMSALQTVYSHSTNIARIILQWSDKKRDNNGTGESPNP